MKGVDGENTSDEDPLRFSLESSKIIQKKPYVYQIIDGKKVEREGRFVICDRRPSPVKGTRYTDMKIGHGQRCIYGFQVASYDKRYPLVIDPTITYSTYLGGSGADEGHGIAVDGDGNAYVTGQTRSVDFPTIGTTTAYAGGVCDAFVTKIGTSGASLEYSTYLGGSSSDFGYGIAVDGDGNAYVTGYTGSPNFPTAGTTTAFAGGTYDAFVTKLGTSGASLEYSTYLGGSNDDRGYGIAVDGDGNAYVTGSTLSPNFPAVGTTTAKAGFGDAFLTKIGTSGASLEYSTYLGGSSSDFGYGIAVDGDGNAYVTGNTGSPNFPTAGTTTAFAGGTYDAFVTKLGTSGASLEYSTYLGGSNDDRGYGIAVDGDGNAYVTGSTLSPDFPAVGTTTANAGYYDAFVTKLGPSGASLEYSTYLGGSSYDSSRGIAVDSDGSAYVTGLTNSDDFPTVGTTTHYAGGDDDAFVIKISGPLPVPSPTPSPSPEPTPSPSPTPTPCTPTQCKLKKITTAKNPPYLVQGESGTITVTLSAKKGCIPACETVRAKVVAGGKKLAISPESQVTDSSGVAEFTMTAAADKKGVATVRFKAGKLKKDVRVKVKKAQNG